jgi:hypothetical protein
MPWGKRMEPRRHEDAKEATKKDKMSHREYGGHREEKIIVSGGRAILVCLNSFHYSKENKKNRWNGSEKTDDQERFFPI